MKPPPDPGGVTSLLVRANNWIGDVVLASPALHALRVRFPRARIAVLARPAVIPALSGSADLDEVIPLASSRAGRLGLVVDLRRRRFDLAVLFQKSFEAGLLAAAAGAKRRYGYATDRRRWLLTDAVEETDAVRAKHHARVFLDLAKAAGAPEAGLGLTFPIAGEDRTAATTLLHDAGVAPSEILVAIHPGASKTPRAWHPERLGRIGARVATLLGGRVVIVGGPADAAVGQAVARAAEAEARGAPPVYLTGRTTIRQMGAVFERSRLFLGSDSGPMHVAAAVGTPVFAVFGPGRPEKTAPFVPEERFAVLSRRFPCSPCRQRFFQECDPAPSRKPWCLEEIGENEAFAVVRDLIERTRARA